MFHVYKIYAIVHDIFLTEKQREQIQAISK